MGTLWQDLRYAARLLARSPGFTLVAVVSLALGISANSTIFSLIDGVWLRPLPVHEPGKLVRIFTGTGADPTGPSSYPDYLDIREHNQSFAGVAAYMTKGFFLDSEGVPEMVLGQVVSEDYFSVLGVRTPLGRTFAPQRQDSAPQPVVVISHRFWRSRLGADPGIIGRSLRLNRESVVVVGVLAEEFRGLHASVYPDVWVSYTAWRRILTRAETHYDQRHFREFGIAARLRPSVTVQQAQAEMESLSRQLEQAYPASNKARRFAVLSERSYQAGRWLKPSLLVLAIVGLVLLIACANVAGLLIARADARRSEVAVRLALGAGRARLMRQLLTESVLLSGLAAGVSLVLSSWLISLLPTLFPPQLGSFTWGFQFVLDRRVAGFTAIVSVLTALLFGLVPAFQAAKTDLVLALKSDPRASRLTRRISFRDVLVVGQVAISLAVLVSAGLLVRSFWESLRAERALAERKLLIVLVPGDRAETVFGQLQERLRTAPWLKQMSFAIRVPLWPTGGGRATKVLVPGYVSPTGEDTWRIKYNSVGPNFFKVMGIRLLRGTEFTLQAAKSARQVALINETMAHRFWPNEDPLGRVLRIGGPEGAPFSIIGVVEDHKINSVREPAEPYVYFPFEQMPSGEVTFVLETVGDPALIAGFFRQEWQAVNPNVPILSMMTAEQVLRSSLYEDKLAAQLVGVLGAVGLFLAGVGVYGMVAFVVSRRTHEIGIRMALGAGRSDIFRHVLGHGAKLGLFGAGAGLAAALALTRVLGAFLFGIRPNDPATFVVVPLLVLAVVLVASYVPARTAAKVDPIQALRYE